jgi:hypothetical protein
MTATEPMTSVVDSFSVDQSQVRSRSGPVKLLNVRSRVTVVAFDFPPDVEDSGVSTHRNTTCPVGTIPA